MGWDISIISTFKEIFAEINSIKEPVGIILFGADSEFKRGVLKKFSKNLSGFAEVALPELWNGLYLVSDKGVLATLSGDRSANHCDRHRTVEALKKIGAKKIIGIYVKQKPIKLNLQPTPDHVARFNWQVDMLLKDPPTAKGLNTLITVSEN